MSAPASGSARSVADQLLIDLQAFVFAAGDRVRFKDIAGAFQTVNSTDLFRALVQLDGEAIISLSVLHNAVTTKQSGLR